MSGIIGRKKEIEELLELFRSDRAEFVAVYGRRRVGKTYLAQTLAKILEVPFAIADARTTFNFPSCRTLSY